MATCLSPFCEGEVIEENARAGRCGTCGLRHGRRGGTSKWDHLVGPLIVTLAGATTEKGSTVPGNLERIEAKAVRFVGLGSRTFITIDEVDGPIETALFARLVSITADED